MAQDQGTPNAPPQPAPVSPARGAGRLWLLVGIAGFFLLPAGLMAWWWTSRPPAAVPPEPATAGVDPEVQAAVAEARTKVLDSPRSADAWGRFGMVLRAHTFEAEADRSFAEAEKLDPGDGRWPYYRGLYAEAGRADGVPRGEPFFRRAAAGRLPGPEYQSAARLKLAEAMFDRQRFDEAESLFREELARHPGDPRATFGVGLVAFARGDDRAARESLAAVESNPSARKKAASHLAALARRAGDAAGAARLQNAAAGFGPDADWPDPFVRDTDRLRVGLKARFVEADNLEQQGRPQEALDLLLKLVASHPSPSIHYKIAGLYAQLGDTARAEHHAREYLRLSPGSAQGHYLMAAVLYRQAKAKWGQESERDAARALFRQAAEHFRASLREKPDNAEAYRSLGQALYHLGETEEALKQMRLAVACRPERYDVHFVLGETLAELGRTDEALPELRTAEQLAPPGDTRARTWIEKLTKKN